MLYLNELFRFKFASFFYLPGKNSICVFTAENANGANLRNSNHVCGCFKVGAPELRNNI